MALTTLEIGIDLVEFGFSDDEVIYVYLSWLILATCFVFFCANAYVIYRASRRKNWARIVLLAMFLFFQMLVSVARVTWPAQLGDDDFWSTAITSAYFVMDAVALYWLFSGAGARWYAAKEA